ncbi:MAG TPA: mucoidy inhibitor MuiA family protein [Gemmataceae bacterium]|nr:mucoidy inhibitor MuiA family protein [Gemmataceae bacterium]
MKKRLFWALGCLALCLGVLFAMWYGRANGARADENPEPAKAETPPKVAASRITHVTVYPDSALVTREVEVPAGAGALELVVTPLPERTVNSSLYSESADGIRVLTTRFRMRPVKENTREEVRKLEDEAKKLQTNNRKIQADLEACKLNMGLFGKLENFTTVSTQHATEKGKLDSEATIALGKYLMDGRMEKTKEMVALQQQMENNAEQLEFVQRKLREMSAGTSKTERDAVIVVDKTNAAAGKVRLNYLVDAAAWRPQYKLRAGKDLKDNVQVEYLAAIMQQTGEDWQNVNLVLSTAQPMLNAAPPDLKMLSVAVVPRGTPKGGNIVRVPQPGLNNLMQQQPAAPNSYGAIPNPQGLATAVDLENTAKGLRKQAQQADNREQRQAGNEIWNYAGALDQARDLVLNPDGRLSGKGKPHAAQNEGPSVTYHLNARLTVPSRNDEQVLEVAKLEMPPEYFYKAVPVLTPHVYKQANLTNKSKHVLLPGEATMYNGTDFVGRMNLPLVAIGEQFIVGFGAEPQLQVHRQMIDKARTMQGGNQVLKYEYRILVNSYKQDRVKLQVWDRLPLAENETMGVSLVKTSPEISKDPLYAREDRPHNLLRWDLEVDPATNGEKAQTIQYEFKLELDKQMTIGSFQSK